MGILSLNALTMYVALGFIGFGVYTLARTLFYQEDARQAKQLLGEEEKNRKASNAIIKLSREVFSRWLVPVVSNLKLDKYRVAARRKLLVAGMADEFTPDELFAFKLFMVGAAPAFIAAVNWVGELGLTDWYWYVGAATYGFFYPDMLVRSSTQSRQKEVRKAIPFIVDLLALSTEAGIDFIGAIGKVVEKAKPSPLVDELEQVLKEIKVGASRSEALKEMAKRLNMMEISSFVAILVSADQMGASIGKILRQQSEQIRNQRFLNAEKEGAKAATKIMFPLMFFIFPAILLTVFAPFLLNMLLGGGL